MRINYQIPRIVFLELILLLLNFNIHAQIVDICYQQNNCSPGQCPSICTDPINIDLDIESLPNSCEIILSCPAGAIIDQQTLPIISGIDFSLNATFDVLTIENNTGAIYDGTINFEVIVVGCDVYTAPSFSFTTTSNCGSNITCCGSACGGNGFTPSIERPKIAFDISSLPVGALTHHNDHFLKFDQVFRYYKIIPTEGKTDFFTLEMVVEPEINILAIDAVDPSNLQPLLNGNIFYDPIDPIEGDGSTVTEFVFSHDLGSGHKFIGDCTNDFQNVLYNNYILIRETILVERVQGFQGTPNQDIATSYVLRIYCNEDLTPPPPPVCYTSNAMTLNIHCRQKNGDVFISVHEGPNYTQNFPALGICPGTGNSQFDYSFRISNGIGNQSPLFGAGTIQLETVNMQVNPQYFEYDRIMIGTEVIWDPNALPNPINLGVSFSPLPGNIGNSGFQAITINASVFAALTQDPDGNGGLTNIIGNFPNPNGSFYFLPEGEHFHITFVNFRLKCGKLLNCSQPAFSVSAAAGSHYMNILYKRMYQVGIPTAAPSPGNNQCTDNLCNRLHDFIWTTGNSYQGFSFAFSDETDLTPTNPSATLTFTHVTNSPISNHPWSIYERAGFFPLNSQTGGLINCPNLYYYAVLTLPNGYSLGTSPVLVYNPFASTSAGSATINQVGQEVRIDWVNLNSLLTKPSSVKLEIEVVVDCNAFSVNFGFDNFPIEFRANCDDGCQNCYRTYGCTSIPLFRHCFGECCPPGVTCFPVGTNDDFEFNRVTYGWSSQNAFNQNPINSDITSPPNEVFMSYECDLIRAYCNGNTFKDFPFPVTGQLNFDIYYDPPIPGANPNNNIFHFERGTFTITPNPTSGINAFQIDESVIISSFESNPTNYFGFLGVVHVSIPVGTIIQTNLGLIAIENILSAYDCDVEYEGFYRVMENLTYNLDFHPMPQVRGEFTMINGTTVYHSCDPWGDNMFYLNLKPAISQQLINPNHNIQAQQIFPTDQCYLRYAVITTVKGGFPATDEFQNEYRPVLQWPDQMVFQIPDGLTLIKSELGQGSFPVWQEITSGINQNGNTVTISGLHTNYASLMNRDKNDGEVRQQLLLTMLRDCPGDPLSDFEVTDLVILDHAYIPQSQLPTPSCQSDIFQTPVTHTPPTDVAVIQLQVGAQLPINGLLNPMTLPITLSHTSIGNALSNSWVYFTSPNPNNTMTLLNTTAQPDGLYHLGSLSSNFTDQLVFEYTCSCPGGEPCTTYDPETLYVHVGNNCTDYPTLAISPPLGNIDDFGSAPEDHPCYYETYMIIVYPQQSSLDMIVNQTQPVGDCALTEFIVQISSNAAEVKNAIFTVVPPLGFYYLNSSTVTGLNQSGNSVTITLPAPQQPDLSWNINNILSSSNFLIDHFALNYELTFNLKFMPDCDPVSNNFTFSVDGTGACDQDLNALVFNQSISHIIPPPPSDPLILITGPQQLSCVDNGQYTVTISNIDPTFNGELYYSLCLPAFASITNPSLLYDTHEISTNCYEWNISVNGISSLNIDFVIETNTLTICSNYDFISYAQLETDYSCCASCDTCLTQSQNVQEDYTVNVCCTPPCSTVIIDLNEVIVHNTTAGGNTGSITLTPSGGTSPYTYLWATGSTSNPLQSLPAGTYTVTVTDDNGCTASATFFVAEPCEGFRTQTQGGWGQPPNKNNNGGYLHANFGTAFPNGVKIGCDDNDPGTTNDYHLLFTDAIHVTAYLPCGGTAAPLTQSFTNPTCTQVGNVFAAQVLTLSISVGFDLAITNFAISNNHLQDLFYIDNLSPFHGWTVAQILIEANLVLGGCTITTQTYRDELNTAITNINESYVDGLPNNNNYLSCIYEGVALRVMPTSQNGTNSKPSLIGAVAKGGNSPYTYSWNTGDSVSHIYNIPTGTYYLTVTDANNDTVTDSVSVIAFTDTIYTVIPGFDHSVNVNNGTLALTDTSYSDCNITDYLWGFYPLGDTSTMMNPVFSYDTAGVYTVCQTIVSTCEDGQMYMRGTCEDIELPEKCEATADFSRNDVVNACSISLNNESTYSGPNASYQWFFGDGTSYAGMTPPLHTYTLNGNYNVCLVATVSGTMNGFQYTCSDTLCNLISITDCVYDPQDSTCVANALFDLDILNCAVYVTDLTTYSGNIISWTWDFGDGTIVYGQYPPPHLYSQSGTYEICLDIEIYNPETGQTCYERFCREINIECETEGCQVYPFFTHEINNCLVSFTNWTLTNGNIISWYWDFDDPNSAINNSGASNPFHQFSQPGWYNVCLTVISYYPEGDYTCEETYCFEIEIRDECEPCEFDCSAEYYIEGCKLYTFASGDPGYININWEYGDGTSGTGLNSIHTYTQPGNYIFCMNVLYDNGIEPPCVCQRCFEITIEDCNPEACELNLDFDFEVVENCVVNFTDLSTTGTNTSILSWYWNFGDGYYSYNQNPQHSYNQSSSYVVCLKIIAWTGEEYCYYELCREINVEECVYTKQTSTLIPYHQTNEIKIIPNPNDGNFTIEFEVINQGVIDIKLLNVLGQIVVKQKHTSREGINVTKFNAGNLPKGVYFLKIDDGYRSRITRVILH